MDINLWFKNGYIYSNGLLKYIKYGQPGEKLEIGLKSNHGGPSIQNLIWDQTEKNSDEIFSQNSIDLEFTDLEVMELIHNLKENKFNSFFEEELSKNNMIAEILSK